MTNAATSVVGKVKPIPAVIFELVIADPRIGSAAPLRWPLTQRRYGCLILLGSFVPSAYIKLAIPTIGASLAAAVIVDDAPIRAVSHL